MAWQGNWQGKWNGHWHGTVEQVPGAMYANLSGGGGIVADITAQSATVTSIIPSGGHVWIGRRKTEKELSEERKHLEAVVQEQRALEAEKEEIAARKAQQDTEQYIQKQIYLALLNEQIAEMEAQKALILARLIEIEEALRLQQQEEQDIAFCMAMLAAA